MPGVTDGYAGSAPDQGAYESGQTPWVPSGTYALVDAFRVVDPVIDDASDRVVYAGEWTHADASQSWTQDDLDRTESFSRKAGDTAHADFWGNGVRVICPKGPTQGIAEISVDGGAATRVDLYAAAKNAAQKVFELANLPEGRHTVSVRVTGDRNTAASDTFVSLDAFEVLSADPFAAQEPGVRLITSARINYPDLGWGNYTDPAITLAANFSATTRMRLLGS